MHLNQPDSSQEFTEPVDDRGITGRIHSERQLIRYDSNESQRFVALPKLERRGLSACALAAGRCFMVDIRWIAIDELTPNRRNARTHSRKQIRQIADSIAAF